MSDLVDTVAAAIREEDDKEHSAELVQSYYQRLAEAAIEAIGLTAEWGVQYDKHPTDVVLGRECNPDGTVTRVSKLDDENHAWQVMASPAPIGAINKCAVTRLVSPWVRITERG